MDEDSFSQCNDQSREVSATYLKMKIMKDYAKKKEKKRTSTRGRDVHPNNDKQQVSGCFES